MEMERRTVRTALGSLAVALVLVMALAACDAGAGTAPTATPDAGPSSAPVPEGFANPELLVDTAWLARHLEDDNIRVLDVNSAAAYGDGHIPGAVNVTTSQFTTTVGDLTNMVTPAADFALVMEQAGVGDDTHVVIVDAGNMLWASRLLWTLEYYGHENVSVLHGGMQAWQADQREVTRKAPVVGTATFTATPDPTRLSEIDDLLQRLDDPGLVPLDNRSAAEYTGEDLRAERGGHIPGAVNIDWTLHLNSGDVSTLKSPSELRALYEGAGITRDKEVVAYCQTAIRGAHGYMVLRLLGYDRVKVYDGSWLEWGNRADTPIEK